MAPEAPKKRAALGKHGLTDVSRSKRKRKTTWKEREDTQSGVSPITETGVIDPRGGGGVQGKIRKNAERGGGEGATLTILCDLGRTSDQKGGARTPIRIKNPENEVRTKLGGSTRAAKGPLGVKEIINRDVGNQGDREG